jgi:hypothetical protein
MVLPTRLQLPQPTQLELAQRVVLVIPLFPLLPRPLLNIWLLLAAEVAGEQLTGTTVVAAVAQVDC